MRHFLRKCFVLVLVFALGFTFLLCCFVHRSEAKNGNGFYLLDPGFTPHIIPTNWQPGGPMGPGLPEVRGYDPLNISHLLGYSYDYIPIGKPLQMLSTSSTGWTPASFTPSDLTQQYALSTMVGTRAASSWLAVPSLATYDYSMFQNAVSMPSFQRQSFTDMIDPFTFRVGPTTHSPAPYTIPSEVGFVGQLLKASSYGKIHTLGEVGSYTPWEWLSHSQPDGYDRTGMSGPYPGFNYDSN
jgi:hypothetical protein